MFATIRSRLVVIGLLVVLAVAAIAVRFHDNQAGHINSPVKLGLDLQGGMHLALELDQSKQVSANPSRDIDLALTVLRKRMDEFGVQEPLVQKVGDQRIVVELAGVTQPERAKEIVQKAAFLEFRITDKTDALAKALPAMDRALKGLGVTGVDTGKAGGAKPGAASAVQQLLGGDSAGKAGNDTSAMLGGTLESLIQPVPTQTPGAYMVPETAWQRVDSLLSLPAVQRQLPRNVTLRWQSQPTSVGVQSYRFLYALEDRPIITGSSLEDAQARLDPLTNAPEVAFTLDRAGGRQFQQQTSRHVGDYMAILLDNRVQGPPPVIESAIGREGRITLGGKTIEDARDLALTLKAGALPTPLKIVEEVQVGPSLGRDSVNEGVVAGLVGTVLVVLIMIGYYRVSGIIAVGGLALYILFTVGGLAAIDATLTLPGLAGIVLSIGIAVDANVLIFERIREELIHGKTVRLAVDEGFRHAMNAIVDSNVSTVLTALFLFQFGTGPVKGFAVTLIMGIIASMVTAVFVTRTFYMIWLDRKPAMSTLSI